MGIKDNFQQALRELTGTDKEPEEQKRDKVDAMKDAVSAYDTAEFDAVDPEQAAYDEIERRAAAAADQYNRQQTAFNTGDYQDPNVAPPPQSVTLDGESVSNEFSEDELISMHKTSGSMPFVEPVQPGVAAVPPTPGQSQTAAPQQNVSYTQQSTGYQQQNVGYTQQNTGYQQQNVGYTQQNTGYQQQNVGYTQQNTGYQQQNVGYTQQNAGHQQQNVGYTQQNTGYQQQNVNYNQPNAGYQQQNPYGRQQNSGYQQGLNMGMGESYRQAPPPVSDPATEQATIFSAARYSRPMNDDDEVTMISRNTVIDGNIRSFANMSVDGNVKGNIETTKDIDVNGKVVGNISCNNAQMRTSQIQGNIQMKGNAYMERDTLLIGDITATYANVNGKIKGNLSTTGKSELKSDAVVFGDISASTITVNDGAIIQGYVSTTFLNKEESRNIFPDTITIGD